MADPQAVADGCHYVGFCALKAADQAAWAGAIGSLVAGVGAMLAAWAALHVAGAERQLRRRERKESGIVAASFIYADLSKLASFGVELHKVAIELSTVEPGTAIADKVLTIRQTAGPMKQMAERISLEWIKALPVEVAANLSRAIGAFPFPCDLIEQTADLWGLMAIDYTKAQHDLRQHAEGLRVPLRRLVKFFLWYATVEPESSAACSMVAGYINAEVGQSLGDDAAAE